MSEVWDQRVERNDPGAAWMLAWIAGDEGAFDAIVEAYTPRVYALLTRFMGPDPLREDLVQETFLRVLRARERYVPSARFGTWLYRIVFNLAINARERESLRRGPSLEAMAAADGSAFEPSDGQRDSALDQLERADAVDEIRSAIASLPENQRMALILAKYEELPYTEIGSVMDISEKAVKSMVHRARESLRARLAHLLEGETA